MSDIDQDYYIDDDTDVDTDVDDYVAKQRAFVRGRRRRRSRIDDQKCLTALPTMVDITAWETADEILEALWQQFIAHDAMYGGAVNYHDLRRMLPLWKRLDPRYATLPAETCQALCYILAQRLEEYHYTGNSDLLIRPRFSFHFKAIKILGRGDVDPLHTIAVYLPRFGVVQCTTQWAELIHFLADQPDEYRIRSGRLFWSENLAAWQLKISFRRLPPTKPVPDDLRILQWVSNEFECSRRPVTAIPTKQLRDVVQRYGVVISDREFIKYMARHWVLKKQAKVEGKNRKCFLASDVAVAAEAFLKR